jgi:fibro-slime domain-containing protein
MSGTVKRISKYTAITSSSVAVIAPTLYSAIIRDFPYGSTEFRDFGRDDNNEGDSDSFVQALLGSNGLPLSTLTDTSYSRKIYSADSFAQWYTKPDVLSLNLDATETLDAGFFGFINYNKFPFTKQTSSAGGYFNRYCWTSEVHTKLTYDVAESSSNPTRIRVNSDDDIWVFLNGKLIINRAGIPGGGEEVNLREIDHGLTGETGTADLAIFHAERREYDASLSVQSSTPMAPVYVYQVIADKRFNALTPQFSLAPGYPAGMTIDPNTGKILWDYSAGTIGNTYTFTINVSDSKLNTDTQTVSLFLGAKPSFTATPESFQSVILGDGFTLTCAATGTPAPTYQWYLNGNPIDGATSTTYTVTSSAYANSGNYTVKATNIIGTASADAYVYVYEEFE